MSDPGRAEEAAGSRTDAAERPSDELLGFVCHELRGPLNAIVGWAHVLREGAHDAELVRHAAETIERHGRRQEQILSDLLDVSRLGAGRVSIGRTAVAVHEPVRAALEALRLAAAAKAVRLEAELDDTAVVEGDGERLRQIAWNLVSNAVKFSSAGGQVRVSLERRDGAVQLAVRDEGIGLAPAAVPRVFEPFWQADALLQRQGLGVGLTIARRLVELHGGTVSAHSDGLGRGALFVVRLPPLASAAAAPAASDPPRKTA